MAKIKEKISPFTENENQNFQVPTAQIVSQLCREI